MTHVDTLLTEPGEDTSRTSTDGPILAFHDQTYTARFSTIDRIGVSRKERDDDTGFPFDAFLVRSDDPFDNCVSNAVLNGNTVDYRRGDEELVLDVQKVFGELDS